MREDGNIESTVEASRLAPSLARLFTHLREFGSSAPETSWTKVLDFDRQRRAFNSVRDKLGIRRANDD
jgi:hypothetical protein